MANKKLPHISKVLLSSFCLGGFVISSIVSPVAAEKDGYMGDSAKSSFIIEDQRTDDFINVKKPKPIQKDPKLKKNMDVIDVKIGTVLDDTKISNIKLVKEGEDVPIIDELENYYEVLYDNDIYYIPKENLIITQRETYDGDNILLSKKYINNRGYLKENIKLNVNGKIKEVLKGQAVSVKGLSNGKFKVELDKMFFSLSKDLITFDFTDLDSINEGAGKLKQDIEEETLFKLKEEQFQRAKFNNKTRDEEQIKGLSIVQEEIVKNSLDLLGTSYLWGSNNELLGLDGSGFIQDVYKKSGLTLPNKLVDQAEIGYQINNGDQLKIGDLLFFGEKKIDHVGLYLGGEQFIHSSSSLGGVGITNIYDDYVQDNLMKVMRVLD